MHRIYLVPRARAECLAEELRRCDIAVVAAPEDGARAVVVASLAQTGIDAAAAALESLPADAVVAAEMPPHFPFAAALLARAERIFRRAPLVIPPLRKREDAARAAATIAAAVSADDESAPKITPEKAVAAARRALDGVL